MGLTGIILGVVVFAVVAYFVVGYMKDKLRGYKSLGCFADICGLCPRPIVTYTAGGPVCTGLRSLPYLLDILPTWNETACYNLAKQNNMKYFGRQGDVECWGGIDSNYDPLKKGHLPGKCKYQGGTGACVNQVFEIL